MRDRSENLHKLEDLIEKFKETSFEDAAGKHYMQDNIKAGADAFKIRDEYITEIEVTISKLDYELPLALVKELVEACDLLSSNVREKIIENSFPDHLSEVD